MVDLISSKSKSI